MTPQKEKIKINIYGKFTGEENYDLLSILVIRLCTDENVRCENQLIKMLNVLLSTELKAAKKKEILEKEHQMKMTTNIEGEVNGMCNLSDLIVEKTEKRVTEEVTTKVTVEEYNNAKQFIKQK